MHAAPMRYHRLRPTRNFLLLLAARRGLHFWGTKTTAMTTDSNSKPPAKLGAEKLTPEEQRRRFIEAAREAGASEDEAEFGVALKAIAKPKKAG